MKQSLIKILFIGDIVGRPGRRAVSQFLAENKGVYDLVIANGENLAAGKGMTFAKYEEMISAGIDYFTSGNHIFNNDEMIPYLDDKKVKVLRPANYPASSPGRGVVRINLKNGNSVILANLQGRVFMKDDIDDPFVTGKNIVDEYPGQIIIIDFHAEATSEKMALGYYLDGKATAILGTHTHVQTADEKILPFGTAFISDVGMSGPENSILGVKKEIIIEKFLTQLPLSHKVATGCTILSAVELEIDPKTNMALSLKRISKVYE